MSFWIHVDVKESGLVQVTTYSENGGGGPYTSNPLRKRKATTVSQALRALAACMVTAKAETIGNSEPEEGK